MYWLSDVGVGFYMTCVTVVIKDCIYFSRLTVITLGTASMLNGMIQKLLSYEHLFYFIIKWMEQLSL